MIDSPVLRSLGWDETFERSFAALAGDRWLPGRVVLEHKHIYRVLQAPDAALPARAEQGTPGFDPSSHQQDRPPALPRAAHSTHEPDRSANPLGADESRGSGFHAADDGPREVLARLAGRLRHQAAGPDDYPAVGDWVALAASGSRLVVRAVLPRRSRFSRKVPGDLTREQVVAANIDTIFLAQGLDRDFNLRRLERYLVLAWESGARPVVILNKADLCDDVPSRLAEASAVAAGVPIHVTSATRREGFEALQAYLGPGLTVALLGSSGVGKSTLINALAGRDLQRTNDLRADGRGRHTTTARQLFVLPGGALAIDTPGLRELQLWDVGQSLEATFADVEAFAADCHFRDCRHEQEPRCAVRAAVADGRLDAGRLEGYVKLRAEAAYLAARQDQAAQAATKRRWRSIAKAVRTYKPRG